ncbi:hypothetical protein [Methylocaldum sp.]|uniref:hypothetical protein n=1 Tax=Methylocaldum sp. TaxID=1969727 RepID=UPI002D5DABFF|nr:hypothetical protein [Methylocaldum sp.]HYE37063.1 hypothetical protein [Methylocaldum sp.]
MRPNPVRRWESRERDDGDTALAVQKCERHKGKQQRLDAGTDARFAQQRLSMSRARPDGKGGNSQGDETGIERDGRTRLRPTGRLPVVLKPTEKLRLNLISKSDVVPF